MRKLHSIVAALGLIVVTAGLAVAQNGTESTASAGATLIAPIAIAKALSLEFGNIVKGTGGTVSIGTDGSRTDSDLALTPGNQKGTVRAATFNVTGEGTMTYSITLPADNAVVLTTGDGSDGTKKMELTNFVSNPSGTGTLTAGSQTLIVGAKLNLGGDEIAGTYSATYSVTVAYN